MKDSANSEVLVASEPAITDEITQETVGCVPELPDQPFNVHDAGTANWLVRAIKEKRAYVQQVQQWAEHEIRRAEREERFLMDRYGPQLEQWASTQVAQLHGRRRCLFLPAGQVGFRREPVSLRITNEMQLVTWCQSQLPQALKLNVEATGPAAQQLCKLLNGCRGEFRVCQNVLKGIVHDHVRSTGETPCGAELTNGTDRFYVK